MNPSRRLALLEASQAKLAAKARLADGGKDARFEAANLYHAAARAEQRALLAMAAPSPEERLATAIERCGCLILGLDPTLVLADAWPEVLVRSDSVEGALSAAMRARIDEMMSRFIKRYEKVRRKMPGLDAWEGADCPRGAVHLMDTDIATFIDAFPGDATQWALRSISRFETGDKAEAWSAIQRACMLMPESAAYSAWELRLVSECLPTSEAEARLRGVYAEIERGAANVEVCFGFVYAAMDLASKSEHRTELLGQVLVGAREGAHAAPPPMVRNIFRTIESIARELLAGRQPDRQILFRHGLGKLAAAAPKEADPWQILRGEVPRLAA